jgi:LacI family transcriptional regulator
MAALNYHGNTHARHLARGHGDSVGLVISDVENPFFPAVVKAFEEAAVRAGYDVLLCTTNYDPARTASAFGRMLAQQTPGVAVMTSSITPAEAKLLHDGDVATVFLDAARAGRRQGSVRIDYAKGTQEAMTYLFNLGHRRFALIAGPQGRPSHAAYRADVEQAGKRLGARVRVIEGPADLAGGAAGVQRLLTEPDLPTAVLCGSDMAAIGAMRALQRAGIRVPEDVSLVGLDDVLPASLTEPPLTTVRIPRQRVGQAAFESLRRLLVEPGARGAVTVVPTELVVRGSTGAAPAARTR